MKHLCARLSIVNQVAVLMLLLGLSGIGGMAISWGIAQSIRGNAHAINTSGSLRMQSYRLLSMVPLSASEHRYLTELDQDLHGAELEKAINDARLQTHYQQLQHYWQSTLIPALISARQPADAADKVASFVRQLNALVLALDHHTEQRVEMVAWVQKLFFAVTLLWLAGTVWYLRRRLLHPWRQLVDMARAIGQGNFHQRFKQSQRQDEMTTLGMALNAMSSQLSDMYAHLDQLVAAKTADLQQKNQILDYLYRTSRQLHSHAPLCARLITVLDELQTLTPLRALQIRLYENNRTEQFSEFSSHQPDRPNYCPLPDCQLCLSTPPEEQPSPKPPWQTLCWNLFDRAGRYGVILGQLPENHPLSNEQWQLIHTLAEQITSTLALAQQTGQQQQLLVMEERAAIARELHDSIAQSLSCLKMQIGFLQHQAAHLPAETRQTLTNMREELNAAYRKLRELLTTFRLQLNEPGLLAALQATIEEFNTRLALQIQLDYRLPANLLAPHQAIHLLQITREALNNILKHANASEVKIALHPCASGYQLLITDNGCGFEHHPQHDDHYGLVIMADRAHRLNGELTLSRPQQGGTQICVHFPPPTYPFPYQSEPT